MSISYCWANSEVLYILLDKTKHTICVYQLLLGKL
jgi:hypothetical protein